MAVVELKSGTGAVVQVIGPVVDVEFSGERLPEILDALEIDREGGHKPRARGAAEPRQQHGANHRHGHHRRRAPRRRRPRNRCADSGPGWRRDARPDVQRHRRDHRRQGPVRRDEPDVHAPHRAHHLRAVHRDGDSRDRHQGHRPHLHLLEGFQDRALRRSRRRQDGHRHGDDPQHRARARGLFGLRRRRRANP